MFRSYPNRSNDTIVYALGDYYTEVRKEASDKEIALTLQMLGVAVIRKEPNKNVTPKPREGSEVGGVS
jgi:hypothetical protein